MIRRRLYTALYLFGIFVFPIVFQPLHIIQHHGHGHEYSEHVHEIDQNSGHTHHHETDCSHESVLPLVSLQSQDHSHDPCLICDYEFPVQDMPVSWEPVFTTYQFNEIQAVDLVLSDLQRVYSQINPRAPPRPSQELS